MIRILATFLRWVRRVPNVIWGLIVGALATWALRRFLGATERDKAASDAEKATERALEAEEAAARIRDRAQRDADQRRIDALAKVAAAEKANVEAASSLDATADALNKAYDEREL